MIYLVITIHGRHFTPSIKAFTNKKDAVAYEKKANELSMQYEKETGCAHKIFTSEIPWKNTKKEFIRYANHYLQ